MKKAVVICNGNQKGGATKTTMTGFIAKAMEREHKILLCDLDPQGNLTKLITMTQETIENGLDMVRIFKEQDCDMYNAIRYGDIKARIVECSDHLHIVPGGTNMALLEDYIKDYKGDENFIIANTLEPVLSKYDYIFLDTPPGLGNLLINGLMASDYVLIVVGDLSSYCVDGVERFIETIQAVKAENKRLEIGGILLNRVKYVYDAEKDICKYNLATHKAIVEILKEKYGILCFRTMIPERAVFDRLSVLGFSGGKMLEKAFEEYGLPLAEEIERRCKRADN